MREHCKPNNTEGNLNKLVAYVPQQVSMRLVEEDGCCYM